MENNTTDQRPRLALSTVGIIGLICFAIGVVVGVAIASKFYPCVNVPVLSVQRDTIIKRDTIQGKVTAPTIRTIIRVDTVKLPSKPGAPEVPAAQPDTTLRKGPPITLLPDGGISIPIEQQTYKTDDYTAVVEGWRPRLVSVVLYPKSTTIRETITKQAPEPRRNWVVAVGPSATYTTDKRFIPGASVTLGFVIKSWH